MKLIDKRQSDNIIVIVLLFAYLHSGMGYTLRKHAYSNILKILPPKYEKFQMKNSDIVHISAQTMDCWYAFEPPRRGGSNEYPQSIFLYIEIRKIV